MQTKNYVVYVVSYVVYVVYCLHMMYMLALYVEYVVSIFCVCCLYVVYACCIYVVCICCIYCIYCIYVITMPSKIQLTTNPFRVPRRPPRTIPGGDMCVGGGGNADTIAPLASMDPNHRSLRGSICG